MEFASEGHEALIPVRRAEKFSNLTQICILLSKISFLFTHGVLLCNLGSYLDSPEQPSWEWAFMPAWLGNSLTALLLIFSWFASCPYIKLCLDEHQPQVNENASILTEVFPSICMAVMGFLFVIGVIIMEYSFCEFLTHRGTKNEAHYENALVATSMTCFSLCLLHSACIKRNTPLYGTISITGLTTILVLECVHLSPHFASVAMVPLMFGLAAALYFSVAGVRSVRDILCAEERYLRIVEGLLIGFELLILIVIAFQRDAQLFSYHVQGILLGLPLVLISALRIRMLWHEFHGSDGTIEARLLKKMATEAFDGDELEMRLRL